jgi:hypothetical protein
VVPTATVSPTSTPTSTPTLSPTPTSTPSGPSQCAAPSLVNHSDSNGNGGGTVSFSWTSIPGVSQYVVQRRNAQGWSTRDDVGGVSFSGGDAGSDPEWRVFASFGSCVTPGKALVFDP